MRTFKVKYKARDGSPKLTRSIRIPVVLDERIKELSTKSLISYNAWVTRVLTREATPKNRGDK